MRYFFRRLIKTTDNDANLREIYSQHWLHIRHIENERLAFCSFYLALLGVGLVYVFGPDAVDMASKLITLGILLLFSFLGFNFMVRALISFWYHYSEIKRITPILYTSEELDYENKQLDVENKIKENEGSLWWLNSIYIRMSKIKGLMVPLTLIFPSIFMITSLSIIVIIVLVFLKII
jgi:hypothetical protein